MVAATLKPPVGRLRGNDTCAPEHIERYLEATSSDTVRSKSYTGKPARMLRSAWTDAWEDPNGPGPLGIEVERRPDRKLERLEASHAFERRHGTEQALHADLIAALLDVEVPAHGPGPILLGEAELRSLTLQPDPVGPGRKRGDIDGKARHAKRAPSGRRVHGKLTHGPGDV